MPRGTEGADSLAAASRPVAAGSTEASSRGIVAQSVSHWFDARVANKAGIEALRDVSLSIEPGVFVSVVGTSGCGKTTLLNIFGGLEQLQQGSVLVGGRQPSTGRDDLAYMFARPALMPWRTSLDNVKFGMEMRKIPRADRDAVAADMLRRVGLADFQHSFPNQLSQGMRQRVALARTFAVDSQILLMDEPFGALDAQTKLVLEDVLLRLWEERVGSTVVFVTHDLAEAVTLSDRVVIMSARPGHIIADVTIDLPRPRTVLSLQESPAYHRLLAELWRYLRQAMGEEGGD